MVETDKLQPLPPVFQAESRPESPRIQVSHSYSQMTADK